MSRLTAKLLFFIALILSCTAIARHSPTYALNPYATGSAVVSATVIGSSIGPPILIAPNDNSATNNPREPLVWTRPSPLPSTPIHHYDVFLDGIIFASTVSDSVTTQNYYFYSITRIGDTFHLYFNTDLADGYHTWKVTVYDNSGINSSSETRTYYIDSSIPILTLKKVDHQTLGWTTADLTTIPDADHRLLTVTTADPLLSGTIEPYVNMQFYLICPQNIQDCTDQFYSGNNPESTWKHRFYNLIPDEIYTVYIAATDAGGNSVIFPEFYLVYGSAAITPVEALPAKPLPTPSPEIEISPLPPTKPTSEVGTPETEIPFTPVPPAAPAPPVFKNATLTQPLKIENLKLEIMFLFIFGLPSHLVMTSYGTQTRLSNLARFLYTLFFPFLGSKKFKTLPFSTLEVFHPNQIDSTHQTVISDINGEYALKEPLPESLFIKIICAGRVWKNAIISQSQFLNTCLFPKLESPQTPPNRLRRIFMTYRSIPLGLACITSGVALVIFPSFYFLIYLYLSFHLVFTEYLYPRLSK